MTANELEIIIKRALYERDYNGIQLNTRDGYEITFADENNSKNWVLRIHYAETKSQCILKLNFRLDGVGMVTEDREIDILKILNDANSKMAIGKFVLSNTDRMIYFRIGLSCTYFTLTKPSIQNYIDLGNTSINKYYDSIKEIAS